MHVVIAGIVAVGLAVMSAYGVCAGIGITFSPLMNVLPFLMLGIGVDDMFVIVNSFDRTPESAPMGQRVAVVSPSCVSPRLLFLRRARRACCSQRWKPLDWVVKSLKLVSSRHPWIFHEHEAQFDMGLLCMGLQALSHAGPSITLTSLTDFAAFMIGSLTSLPALAAFCQYAAVGVVFCFILQVAFFTSILAFDASVKSGENCCRFREPCSVRLPFASCGGCHASVLCLLTLARVSDGIQEDKCCLGLTVTTKNNQENFVRKYVAEPMRSLPVKLGVLLVFTVLTVCGIYGCTQVTPPHVTKATIADYAAPMMVVPLIGSAEEPSSGGSRHGWISPVPTDWSVRRRKYI